MSVYFFLWNPEKDPDSFVNYTKVQRAALGGKPYATNWICPSTRPKPGDTAIMQRTGRKNNGVFATGIVTVGTYEDEDGVRCVELSLDSFLPLGKEIPRDEIVGRAKYTENWCPMSSGNEVPGPLVRAIDELWGERQD